MARRVYLAIAGLAGAVSVCGDAAATHLLAGDPSRLQLATTAARYGLIHAAVLVALALPIARDRDFLLAAAAWCFVAGLALFSGSLGLVAAGAPHGFAVAAPWGGTAFILGWLAILIAALRPKPA